MGREWTATQGSGTSRLSTPALLPICCIPLTSPLVFLEKIRLAESPPTWSSERHFTMETIASDTPPNFQWSMKITIAGKLRYFLHSGTLQPCFPLKILHLHHCCSNVSGYQRGPACCDKAVTNKSDVSRREDSVLQWKVPNIFCKFFFFNFCTLKRKIVESLASCLGVLSLLQKAKVRDAC